MPTPCLLRRAGKLLLAAALLGLTFTARAAQTPVTPSGHARTATNAAPAEPQLLKSVFIDPSFDGKDPFYPLSTRLHKVPAVATTTTKHPAVLVDLQLKGISGAANHRLAIINNRTFGVGEEGEVTGSSGSARITCAEITDDSVRVIVNGQERTLHLRPNS